MANDLKWTTKTVKLSELKGLDNNPRTVTDEKFNKLDASIGELGNFRPLVVDHDLTVLGGNQRYKVLSSNGYEEVEVTVPTRKLSKRERELVVLHDNVHAGEFDFEMLAAEFDADILAELDIELPEMGDPEFNAPEDGKDSENIDDEYPAESGIRMVQLLFNPDQHARFMAASAAVQPKLNTINISETVIKALEYLAENIHLLPTTDA